MSPKDTQKDWVGIDGSDDTLLEDKDEQVPQAEGEGEAEGTEEVLEVQPEQAGGARKRPARDRTSRRRPAKKAPASKKKLYTVIAVALIILLPIIGLAYFFYGPAGDIKKIDIFIRPYASDDDSGMVIISQVDTGKPSSLSGPADLVISHNGSSVYTGKMDVQDSRSSTKISLGTFAVENGNYSAQFTFQGASGTAVFPVGGIIEKLNATAWAINDTINATIAPPGTARLGVRVIMTNMSGGSELTSARDKLTIEIGRGGTPDKYTETLARETGFEKDYPLPGNGNYTVKVTYQNSKVKPGSKFSEITVQANDSNNLSHAYVYVAIPPQADAGPNQTVQWKVQDQGAVVTLDGSRSMAYDGASIIQYWWNYNDGTAEDGIKVTHKYTQKNDAETPFYVVTLTVTDSNGQMSSDEVDIVVK